MQNKHIGESFAHAFEGFSHVLWTQKHVRFQVFMVMVVLLGAYFLHLPTVEVLFVLSATAFVLVAELFNTAIEVVVNMITESYHPLAKIAKDVAAAGVLLASTYACIVGCAIFGKALFYDKVPRPIATFTEWLRGLEQMEAPDNKLILILLAVGVVSIIVALAKIKVGHGTILRGGAVSGHSAVAFLLFGAIAVYGHSIYVTILALCLAILVAQSRVEGKIHSLAEVLWGAVVALVLMTLLLVFSQAK
jgi:diacylglycerol kinase (ATP)